jgi:hypothetical protein
MAMDPTIEAGEKHLKFGEHADQKKGHTRGMEPKMAAGGMAHKHKMEFEKMHAAGYQHEQEKVSKHSAGHKMHHEHVKAMCGGGKAK